MASLPFILKFDVVLACSLIKMTILKEGRWPRFPGWKLWMLFRESLHFWDSAAGFMIGSSEDETQGLKLARQMF